MLRKYLHPRYTLHTGNLQVAPMYLHFYMLLLLRTLHPLSNQSRLVTTVMKTFLVHLSRVSGNHPKKDRRVHYKYPMPSLRSMTTPKPVKRKIRRVEHFDPTPAIFRGSASSRLPELLEKLNGEQLCISLLFDPRYTSPVYTVFSAYRAALYPQPTRYNNLKMTMFAFKKTLEISKERSHAIHVSASFLFLKHLEHLELERFT